MESFEPGFRRQRAQPWLRLLLKAPVLVYRGPVAMLMRSRCVMLLTTRGRRTGQPRTIGISFMPLDGRYIVFAGWGVNANWYRNVRANPEVIINVGGRRMRAMARLVEDPERRKALMLRMQAGSGRCGPPKPIRPFLKRTGLFDYEGELTMAVQAGGNLPVVEITPQP